MPEVATFAMFWCLELGCYSSASFEISSEVRVFICYILLLIAACILRSVATNTAWPIAIVRHTTLCTFNFCLIEVPVSIKICMISLNPALTGRSAIWHFKHSEVIEIRSGIIFDFYMRLSHILFLWDSYTVLSSGCQYSLKVKSSQPSELLGRIYVEEPVTVGFCSTYIPFQLVENRLYVHTLCNSFLLWSLYTLFDRVWNLNNWPHLQKPVVCPLPILWSPTA